MDETRQHNNHTITITPSWEFVVTGPEFDDSKYRVTFASFDAARAEITKRVEESARISAANVTLMLRVFDSNGNTHTIERINRTNGNLHGVTGNYVYPIQKPVGEMLRAAVELRIELQKIYDKLEKVAIKVNRRYGRLSVEDYTSEVEDLKAEHTKALAEIAKWSQPVTVAVDNTKDGSAA